MLLHLADARKSTTIPKRTAPVRRGGAATVPEPFDITDTRANVPLHPVREKVVPPHEHLPATTFGKGPRDMHPIDCSGPIAASEAVISRVAFQGGVAQQQYKYRNHCGSRGYNTIVNEDNFNAQTHVVASHNGVPVAAAKGDSVVITGGSLANAILNSSLGGTSYQQQQARKRRLTTAPTAARPATASAAAEHHHLRLRTTNTNTLRGHRYKVDRFAIYGSAEEGRGGGLAVPSASTNSNSKGALSSATDTYLDKHRAAAGVPDDMVDYERLLNPERWFRRRAQQAHHEAVMNAQQQQALKGSCRATTAPSRSPSSRLARGGDDGGSSSSSASAFGRVGGGVVADNHDNQPARFGSVRDTAALIESHECRTTRPKLYEQLLFGSTNPTLSPSSISTNLFSMGGAPRQLVGASRRNDLSTSALTGLRVSTFAGRGPGSGMVEGCAGAGSSGAVTSPGPSHYQIPSTFAAAMEQGGQGGGVLRCGERKPMAINEKNGLAGIETNEGANIRRLQLARERQLRHARDTLSSTATNGNGADDTATAAEEGSPTDDNDKSHHHHHELGHQHDHHHLHRSFGLGPLPGLKPDSRAASTLIDGRGVDEAEEVHHNPLVSTAEPAAPPPDTSATSVKRPPRPPQVPPLSSGGSPKSSSSATAAAEARRSIGGTRYAFNPAATTNSSYVRVNSLPGRGVASTVTYNAQLKEQHKRRDRVTNATPERTF